MVRVNVVPANWNGSWSFLAISRFPVVTLAGERGHRSSDGST
jgi:hypothetical protein